MQNHFTLAEPLATQIFPSLPPSPCSWLCLVRLSPKGFLCVCVCSVVSSSLQPHGLYPIRLLCPWNFPGKNTGVDCHALLQGIFPTQGSNSHLLHGQVDSLLTEPLKKPPTKTEGRLHSEEEPPQCPWMLHEEKEKETQVFTKPTSVEGWLREWGPMSEQDRFPVAHKVPSSG